MVTEAQRAKITAAIDGLNEKQVALLAKFNELRSFNAAAWAEYGSELCANEMIQNDYNIVAEIIANKKTKDLLSAFLDGIIQLTEEEFLLEKERLFAGTIRSYEVQRAEARARLEQIYLIKSFLQ